MSKSVALLLVLVCLTASSIIIVEPASFAETMENSWKTMTPIPEKTHGIGAAAANGKIYVMGGSINYEYDPATNEWTEKKPMPTSRNFFSIAAYQNKIYVLGGRVGWTQENGTIDSNANEVYDPSTDTWQILSPMPMNISYINANVVNGEIYMLGGLNRQDLTFSLNEVYDIATDSWTNKSTMPYPVSSYASAVVDNRIYIIGGLGYLFGNQTQIYDPRTDSWSLGTPIPTPVFHAAAGATTGIMSPKRIYVIGGSDLGGSEFPDRGTKLNQVYDPETDTWTLGTPMPTARLGLAVAVVNDQLYAIGGSSMIAFSPELTRMERYTPFGYGIPDPSYDVTAPEVTLISPENKTYHGTSVSLEFLVNEPVAWMHYNLDNENITEISGNATITGLSLGSHNLTVYATDDAGNTGASQTIHFTVAEPFPTTLVVIASVASVAIISMGLLIYLKKRKR